VDAAIENENSYTPKQRVTPNDGGIYGKLESVVTNN
jgi:hypothetical protein